MDIHLKAKLQDAIEHWAGEGVDGNDWPAAYFGGETLCLMTGAAASVFDAVIEFQQYAVKEGFFDEA